MAHTLGISDKEMILRLSKVVEKVIEKYENKYELLKEVNYIKHCVESGQRPKDEQTQCDHILLARGDGYWVCQKCGYEKPMW